MALLTDPGVKVVGDQGKGKTGLFGSHRKLNKIVGRVLLAGKVVSDLRDAHDGFLLSDLVELNEGLRDFRAERENGRAVSQDFSG